MPLRSKYSSHIGTTGINSRWQSTLAISLVALWALGCGSKTNFQGSTGPKEILPTDQNSMQKPEMDAKSRLPKSAPLQETEALEYRLEIAGGQEVLAAKPHKAKLYIIDTKSAAELQGEDAKAWTASTQGVLVPELKGALGEREIDFSKAEGYVKVEGTFVREKDKLTGFHSQTVFIDNQPPTATMVVAKKESGQYVATINIVDNFKLDEGKSQVLACKPSIDKPFNSSSVPATLSPQCVILHQGEGLKSKMPAFGIEPVEIEGQTLDPSQLRFFVSATDSVGNVATNSAIEFSGAVPFLELSLEKDPAMTIRGGEILAVKPLLLSISGGQTTEIHKDASLWADYVLELTCQGAASSSAFGDQLTLDTTGEGPKNCSLLARKPNQNLKSNKVEFGYVVDKTPPTVSGLRVKNPQGFLDPQTQVTLSLNVADENGVASQKIEYRPKGSPDWVLLADVPAGDTSIVVKWDGRSTEDFEVRVIAVDRAGNTTVSDPVKWSRPFFNAAVLTTSVDCFFCHLKIDGDVAGINFPATVHSSTGENFLVTGKVYATGTVPAKISNNSAGKEENYRNQGLKVFPNTKDAQGVPIFPVLSEAKLEGNVNGSLTNGGTLTERVQRIHQGDLIVEGTETKPFVVSGEVFIKGNLYIKGVYKGQGTIYAQNIFVVNDIVSADCLKPDTCPFPFTGTEAEKIAQAQAAIAQKKSALYLGALNEILIGDRDHKLNSSTAATNVSDFHQSLGTQASYLKFPDGSNFICCYAQIINPTTSEKVNVEVNRVDAYLYAHRIITWRSYANLLINGGFMGYKAYLASSIPYRVWHNSYPNYSATLKAKVVQLTNPRNGLNIQRNEIRYDYRLRAGGPGFETLKEFFND